MKEIVTVAEIGINANGDVDLAKDMIRVAKSAGCNFVKFQKRTVEKVYTQEYLNQPRESPWGQTNRDQKMGLEFGEHEYDEIDLFCRLNDIKWFASPWDCDSVEFLKKYDPPFMKVASACVTDERLLDHIKATEISVILSTGMSTRKEIHKVTDFLGEQIEYVLACTSTYPAKAEELNLNFIHRLKAEYGMRYKIGYSNHSPGIIPCVVAAALGAKMVEFHITLDRAILGSDQAASIETPGIYALCKHLRNIPSAMGTGDWTVFDSEKAIKKKLRRY